MSRAGSGRELTQWMDDAQYALTAWAAGEGDGLSMDTLRALVATPQRPHRDVTDRHTFWTEEYERVMKAQLRDTIPLTGGTETMRAWRARQDARQAQMESVLDAHAECLVAAAVPVVVLAPSVRVERPTPVAKRRLTPADMALQTMQHERAA